MLRGLLEDLANDSTPKRQPREQTRKKRLYKQAAVKIGWVIVPLKEQWQ
jgi:hypothetical protein